MRQKGKMRGKMHNEGKNHAGGNTGSWKSPARDTNSVGQHRALND